ncbi:MAG: DUF2795 domain-containing protein [Novosphingobium sp.]|jgi:hypothetical protein
MPRGMGGHSPSNVSAHLKGIEFPAEKDDLCRQAEENGVEPAVMEVLEALEEGPYEPMADVMSAYGNAAAEARDEAEEEDEEDDR